MGGGEEEAGTKTTVFENLFRASEASKKFRATGNREMPTATRFEVARRKKRR